MKRYMNIERKETDALLSDFEIHCSYYHIIEAEDEWIGYSHCHKTYELAYVLSGEGEYFANDISMKIMEGDLIVTPPFCEHYEKEESDTSFSIIFLNVTHAGKQAKEIENLFGELPVKISLKEKKVKNLMNNLSYELYVQQPGFYTMIMQYLKELYIFTYRHIKSAESAAKEIKKYQRGQSAEITSKVKEYVLMNLSEKINIEKMAEYFFYHPKYLNTIIRMQTGETLTNYIQSIRIQEACTLLAGSMPISNIAEATGYSSVPYFYKCFESRMNVTPNQYRISLSLAKVEPYKEEKE